MTGRRRLGQFFLIAAAVGAGMVLGLAALLRGGGSADPLTTLAVAAVAVVGAVTAGLWFLVDRKLLRDLVTVAAEARLMAHGTADAQIPAERYPMLAPLPDALNELGEKLARARQDVDRAVAASTARAEEQKSRLAAVLRDLHEGVVVCNLYHQVLLYNQAALSLLHLSGGDLGIGRNLLQVVSPQPLLHTLERLTLRVHEGRHLQHARGVSAAFVAGTAYGRHLLQGKMSLILQDDDTITGYVVSFEDVTRELQILGQRDALLRAVTEGFRGPVANLRAAVETLSEHGDLAPEERAAFDRIIAEACATLTDALERVTVEYRSIITGAWPMGDLHTGNLLSLVCNRINARGALMTTLTGLPQWVHGDFYTLAVLIDHLVGRIAEATGVASFDLSAEPDGQGRWIYVDISWRGAPLSSEVIDRWTGEPPADVLGGLTVGDVLQHHRSELWSEPGAQPGTARLRLPLPPAVERHGHSDVRKAPARPEFFDFSLLHQPLATGELGGRPLHQLTFVVFDTETTGLRPSEGDEMVAIAGVRIVNGRILTGETFSQLINPGRPIPPPSVRFHGITDDMVRDAPRAETVLRRFKTFTEGAVLVAHNAAFDLKFLKMKERAAGVRFDNPILDTLLLSRLLQGEEGDHALDAIATRLGIRIVDRHTALGDALLTAAIFLRFVDMLAERGIRTLDDAIRSANILVELHARERAF